jgi:predicted alpha/beta superfamily hydrolase
MRILLTVIFLLPVTLFCQVTIQIEKIPETTPEATKLFVVGNFNNWQPGDENFKLNYQDNKFYSIYIESDLKELEFKFIRDSSWTSVEGDKNGFDIPNRKCLVKDTVINIVIESWRDIEGNNDRVLSTTSKNVHVVDSSFYIPQLDRNRKISIYLPPGYKNSDNFYPVLYMHDGQNLFDNTTSNFGEWEVDEILNSLNYEEVEVPIVVGIDHGGKKRIDEYSPFINLEYGGGEGEAYVDFIVQTLKPFIDNNYRTKSEREYTSIWGSSLGGLISTFAGVKYQNVFSKVGAFSSSYWFSDSIYSFLSQQKIEQQFKIYMLAGGKESETTEVIDDAYNMRDALTEIGLKGENVKIKVDPNGEHNETFWRNEFKEAFLWLFN